MSQPFCDPPQELVGYGSYLQYWDYVQQEWITVAGTNDLAFPEMERAAIETDGDDGDGTQHKIGSPQLMLNDTEQEFDFTESQYAKLFRLHARKKVFYTCWRIVVNSPRQFFYRWCGFISLLGTALPKKELVKANLNITHQGGLPEIGFLNE